jgi:arylsulfatase A-like enzyme
MRIPLTTVVAVLTLAAATGGRGAETARARPRPNVLLIVMDTVRADHLSGYGYEKPTAPSLERIAAEGVLYEQAISPGSWTLPSHATLFTGLYPRDHHTTAAHWKLDDSFTTLAEILAAEGYATAAFSNNPWVSHGTGLAQGFAAFLDMWRDDQRGRGGDDGAALTNELVLDLLGSPGRTAPFFVFINYLEPHLPYAPPASFERRFVPSSAPRALVDELRGWKTPRELAYILRVPGYEATGDQFRILGALYDAEIAYLDSKVGELVQALDSRGLLKDTLLIVTSDHGEHLGDHHMMDHKMSVYDALIHVPLIVRYPGVVPAGVRIRGPVQTNDVFPTVLKLCGIERPRTRDATVLPMREEDVVREDTFAEFGRPTEFLKIATRSFPGVDVAPFDRSLVAVRGPRYKYVWATDGRSELFDLGSDPSEEHDLSAGQPEVEARLRREVFAFRDGAPALGEGRRAGSSSPRRPSSR